MNLVVRIGDEFVTPPLGGSILAGVTRDSVMTLLREWGFPAHERPIGMEELIAAHRARRRCARSSAAAPPRSSPRSARSAGRARTWSSTTASRARSSRRLFDAITGIQYGREPDKHGWMTSSTV